MKNAAADVVTETKCDVRSWTVMVYMAAGDSAEMDDYAVRDLLEMQRGANEHVHVAVQIKRHWPDLPQRYVIVPNGRLGTAQLQPAEDPTNPTDLTATDMGKGETLGHFLEWAVKACPAHHYMLVLWGHAYGLGFGRDHGDPLRLSELVKALDEFRKERTKLPPDVRGRTSPLDILGTNACAMSYVEAAYELRKSASYLLASQISVPFAGWPYDAVLQSITEKTEPDQLGFSVIDSYVTGLNNPLTGERVQMSLLHLPQAGGLRDVIDGLAADIRGAFKSEAENQFDSGRLAAIRDAFIASAAGDVRPLVDLKDLARALRRDLCDRQSRAFVSLSLEISVAKRRWLKESARSLEQRLDEMERVLRLLVVKNAFHPSLAELGGVGIYVPFVTDEQDLRRLGLDDDPFRSRPQDPKSETSKATYERLALFQEEADGKRGTWPALVYDDLKEPLPSELVELIGNIGVTSSTDRAEIAQIVLSIESTFNKLDRILDSAQTVVMGVLRQAPFETHASYANGKQEPLRLMPLAPATGNKKAAPRLQVSEPILLEWFRKLELVLEEIERTTRKGLTQSQFGLGPVVSPRGFSPDAGGKTGEGAPSRDDRPGFAGGKTGEGAPVDSKSAADVHALDGDPEVLPAFRLFSRAAEALRRLEQATSELEREAGESLGKDVFERRALGLRQAFGILCETAISARRTIRRVIANPAYGLGPGAAFDRDDREELANAAGMSARNLLLLNVNSLTPEPDKGEFIYDAVVESARKAARERARKELEGTRPHARRAPVPVRR